jgi:hypothetical protein
MKIRPLKAELFHADGRTDITDLIVAFRHFINAPKEFTLTQYTDSPPRHMMPIYRKLKVITGYKCKMKTLACLWANDQLDAQLRYIIILYMFRATLCSS